MVEAEQDPAKANPLEYAMKARKIILQRKQDYKNGGVTDENSI